MHKRFLRWLILVATRSDTCIGILITLYLTVFALWFYFLAGAIIVNVLDEELPEGRQADSWRFFAGAVLFTGLALGLKFKAV